MPVVNDDGTYVYVCEVDPSIDAAYVTGIGGTLITLLEEIAVINIADSDFISKVVAGQYAKIISAEHDAPIGAKLAEAEIRQQPYTADDAQLMGPAYTFP